MKGWGVSQDPEGYPQDPAPKTGLHRIQGRHKVFTGSVCNTRLSQDPPPPQGPHKIQTQTWNLSRSTISPDPPRDPFCQMRGPVEIQVVTKVQYRCPALCRKGETPSARATCEPLVRARVSGIVHTSSRARAGVLVGQPVIIEISTVYDSSMGTGSTGCPHA